MELGGRSSSEAMERFRFREHFGQCKVVLISDGIVATMESLPVTEIWQSAKSIGRLTISTPFE